MSEPTYEELVGLDVVQDEEYSHLQPEHNRWSESGN